MMTKDMRERPRAALGLAAALLATAIAAAPARAQDDPTGAWNSRTSGNDSFTSGGAATDGAYLYLVGGNQVGAVSSFPDTNRQVRRYDPAADAWTALADLITPTAGNAAACHNGRLYTFGGGTFMTGSSSLIAFLDLATGEWTELATSLNAPRQNLAAATLGDRIYVTGGIGNEFSSLTEEFDPATGSVTVRASLPAGIALHAMAAVTANNRLYIATGFDSSGPAATVYEFTPPSGAQPDGAWTIRTAYEGGPRYSAAAFAIQGRVYVTGGFDGSSPRQETWEYNPSADAWSRRADMADLRHMHGAAAIGGTGFVYGGEGVFSCEAFTAPVFEPENPSNRAPTASAGSDDLVEATSAEGAAVTLNGSGSDPDGDALTYSWSGSFGQASGPSPTVLLALGSHELTLTVSDGADSATDTVVITVSDTTAPEILELEASPGTIKANSKKWKDVTISALASDGADPDPAMEIVNVSSNQPSGSNEDWLITGDLTLKLRAERSNGQTRIYTITVRVTDSSGNSSFADVTVSVLGSHDCDKGSSSQLNDDDDDDDDDDEDSKRKKKSSKKEKKGKKSQKDKKGDDD